MCQEVSQVETELKTRAAVYNSVKISLQSLEHKEWVTSISYKEKKMLYIIVLYYYNNLCLISGPFQTRGLNDIIRKEDLVDSEYLTTLLVLVSRSVIHVHKQFKLLYLHFMVFCHVLFMCCSFCLNVFLFGHRGSYLQWERTYESLSEFVVPRSSRWAAFICSWL